MSTGHLVRTLHGWPPGTGRLQRAIGSLAFSPDGTRVAAGFGMPAMRMPNYGPQMLKVWDPRTGVELAAWDAHQNTIAGLAFAPDGSRLATASMDQTVKLWEVGSWRELRSWDGRSLRSSLFQSVAFSTDGATLAAGTFGGTIVAWDVATGRERFVLPRAHSFCRLRSGPLARRTDAGFRRLRPAHQALGRADRSGAARLRGDTAAGSMASPSRPTAGRWPREALRGRCDCGVQRPRGV